MTRSSKRYCDPLAAKIAAEHDQLREVNAELVTALEDLVSLWETSQTFVELDNARAALAKGRQT